MDTGTDQVTELLRSLGYTDRYISEHWGGDWHSRRWFGFEAPDAPILQVVTANAYTRITLIHSKAEKVFALRHYVSEAYPERPKTDFHLDPFGESPTMMGMGELTQFIQKLGAREDQEAA